MKNCYIYTRVSTVAQIDGYSLEAQQHRLRDYAAYKDWRIAGEYCDAGKSGHSISGRPEFMRMLDDIRAEKDDISYVLVFKLSRFGRNAADIHRSLQILMDYEVDLVCIQDAIDSSTQGGRLTLSILSAVAEMERENITAQFNAGRMQKIMSGGWPGGQAPFGYRTEHGSLVPDPDESALVKEIYDLYLQDDMSASSLVNLLNQNGRQRRTKDGDKPISYDFITRILDNPVYSGRIYYNRRTNNKDPNRKKKDVFFSEGSYIPIVSVDQWERVQSKRTSLTRKAPDSEGWISPLVGILKCPVCGRGMIHGVARKENRNSGGFYKPVHYYVCRYSRKQEGSLCSSHRQYNQEKLDSAVYEIISHLTTLPLFQERIEEAFGDRANLERLAEEMHSLNLLLKRLEKKQKRLGEDLDNLDIMSDSYDAAYEEIQNELDQTYDEVEKAEEQKEEIRTQQDILSRNLCSAEVIRGWMSEAQAIFPKMNGAEVRKAYRLFIEQIAVYPEVRKDGRILKSISFKFPVYYETVEPFAEKEPDGHLSFRLDCSVLPATAAEAKVSYSRLRQYIWDQYKVKVPSLYIAQVKKKYGLETRKNYNVSRKEKQKVPKCPAEKEAIIVKALKHFRMLDQQIGVKV